MESQFNQEFSSHWDQLIDWEARTKSENNFIKNILQKYGSSMILDVATGTGFDSIQLLLAGFDVTSIDGSQSMLEVAKKNAKNNDVTLKTYVGRWGSCVDLVNQKFDAIICLGNSFACATNLSDRIDAVNEWASLLNTGGILIVDHRNYDDMLKFGLSHQRQQYYLGKNVDITPALLDSEMTKFRYKFPDGMEFDLDMYPILKDEIIELFRGVGFNLIESYGDRILGQSGKEVSFYLHILKKGL